MAARGRAKEYEHKERAWLAWQTASLNAYAYHAPKKMPTLDSLTAAKPVVRIQTPEQMKAVFAAMRKRGA